MTGLDAKNFERGLGCWPEDNDASSGVLLVKGVVVAARRVVTVENNGVGMMKSGGTFHISCGHETVIGKVNFFGSNELHNGGKLIDSLDVKNDAFLYQDKYVVRENEFDDDTQ